MKALVYKGPNKISLEERPKPQIEKSTDCIIKISKTTICGTDLHIIKGEVPTVAKGRILGHEGVGTIEAVGNAVSNFQVHDKVLISCITSCGKCAYCKKQMYSQCEVGGWLLGNKIDGTQAEYVRIPFADTSLHAIPSNVDEDLICLFSDVLPTGYETGVLKGKIKLGDKVAIIGAGPVGLAVLLTAQFYSPSEIVVVDKDNFRLEVAKLQGAKVTINGDGNDVIERVLEMTNQKGFDIVIEAVGKPETFETCQAIVAPGGYIANVGVHGKSVCLHLEKLWNQNITITTGLVDTFSISTLLKTFATGMLKPGVLITHHFDLTNVIKAYEVFADAANQHALKVILETHP
ncbi:MULTISPECIES: zinc-dependent alcohol dehydrogenase family protein [Parachlamydia]|jgi:alcohol dehydrogenase|uniref:zinc-dependent alcohol dehydrogenase family protein n=1 Tax=Parachlamydia TaxID=83551 RepID=UPI0001C17724|nr:zinc-dependent alcohol dehydrogenase family protein [Parachlamydia acanthamoebae]EFB41169.1 hypothetical protein pah_c050o156 [Parachlamydia acanthamoebae str. Hall's coccus]